MVGQNIGLIPVLIKHGYLGNPQTNWKMTVLMGTHSINRVGLCFVDFLEGKPIRSGFVPQNPWCFYISPWKWPNWLVWEIPNSWTYPQIIKYPWVFEIASGKRLHSENHHFYRKTHYKWPFSMLHYWLVVDLPLWKKRKSVGMMKFPRYGKS